MVMVDSCSGFRGYLSWLLRTTGCQLKSGSPIKVLLMSASTMARAGWAIPSNSQEWLTGLVLCYTGKVDIGPHRLGQPVQFIIQAWSGMDEQGQ